VETNREKEKSNRSRQIVIVLLDHFGMRRLGVVSFYGFCIHLVSSFGI